MDSPAPGGGERAREAAAPPVAPDAGSPPVTATLAKDALRRQLEARRLAASRPDEVDRDARALALCAGSRVVACYLSLPGEPGTAGIIAGLRRCGVEVLLPVLRRDPDWATDSGGYRPSWRGIPEPVGPRLGATALAGVEVIIVAGLAGTEDGRRLGTGGGWYDRALAHADPGSVVVLLLDDPEVLPDVPTEAWDRPVDVILTPTRTIHCTRSRSTGSTDRLPE